MHDKNCEVQKFVKKGSSLIKRIPHKIDYYHYV